MIFDTAILDAMKVDVGDKVEVTVHSSGAVTLTPMKPVSKEDFDTVLNDVLTEYNVTLKKLS